MELTARLSLVLKNHPSITFVKENKNINYLNELSSTFYGEIPVSYCEFLNTFRGEEITSSGLFASYFMLTARGVITTYEGMNCNIDDFIDDDVEASKEIIPVWWSKEWLPFASTAGGHLLCLDFMPNETGFKGQVIMVFTNSNERIFLAKSFDEFLKNWITVLEKYSSDELKKLFIEDIFKESENEIITYI